MLAREYNAAGDQVQDICAGYTKGICEEDC